MKKTTMAPLLIVDAVDGGSAGPNQRTCPRVCQGRRRTHGHDVPRNTIPKGQIPGNGNEEVHRTSRSNARRHNPGGADVGIEFQLI